MHLVISMSYQDLLLDINTARFGFVRGHGPLINCTLVCGTAFTRYIQNSGFKAGIFINQMVYLILGQLALNENGKQQQDLQKLEL